ncbi:uncharacterized protein [Lolium perenne]|uniref:uncharacterized protein n=1 Tax=Lolium perenne TaxID=4522 RepID=UPI003A98FFAC
MTSRSLPLSTNVGAIISSPATTIAAPAVVPTIAVRLDRNNYMLWRALTLTNFSGASLHGHLDGTTAAPSKTLTEGGGADARVVDNPDYHRWWTQDQKVLGLLLSSMTEDIVCQLLGCPTAAAAWSAVQSMFGAQNRAGVQHMKRQIQALKKQDMTAGEYMQKVKALADAMATAGSPLSDDDIIDYMLIGSG